MDIDPEIVAIQTRAKSAGVEISAVLKEAGVAPTTWYRWTEAAKKFEPRRATLRKIHQALDQIGAAA